MYIEHGALLVDVAGNRWDLLGPQPRRRLACSSSSHFSIGMSALMRIIPADARPRSDAQ
ncbi:MAG TPA: hypothetical protein VMW33_15215 [Ilumatobacteraceae bacterium]|nr:hypothetical protein [Ilumatobacteraceae bacterium]